MGRKSGKLGRKKAGDKDLLSRRPRWGRQEVAEGKTKSPCFVDSTTPAGNEMAATSATVTAASRLSPSYFLCHECFKDTEQEEPVITFCGHVFCWACLHRSITSEGINRLRGECPFCKYAVDLSPRTKTVCPIYYVEGPQAFPPKHREMKIRENTINIKGKSKLEDSSDSESTTDHESRIEGVVDSYAEIMKERLKRFIKVDPSKRPSDMRPNVSSSFITFSIYDNAALHEFLFCSMQNLFSRWKSTKAELNDIILKIHNLSEEFSVKLVNEHEREVQTTADLLSEMPAKIQRTDNLSSCVKKGMDILLTEEVNPSQSSSGSSSSLYFSCNVCYGNPTLRQPIITYCGHVFCWFCFYDHVLQCCECPVCKSAVDASTACPISVNGENQMCKIIEGWQTAVLILDPSALQLQIHSMMYDLDHEIVFHTESFYDTIMKLLDSMDELSKGIAKHIVLESYSYLSEESINRFFPKDDVGHVLGKANVKSSNIPIMHSQEEIQTELSMTSTPPSLDSHFRCEWCHKYILADPVVTYCTHLFCWHCLYLEIKANGRQGEDGSLHGPCPVCKTNNIVLSNTTAKLTVIPICKGPESIRREHKRSEREDRTREIPPRPFAKRISVHGLKAMRDCVSQTMSKIKSLTDTLQLKMYGNEEVLDSAFEIVKYQRHRLLLGLLDGWCWSYMADRDPNVVGTDDTETLLNDLSRSWLDVVDVESACTLFNKEEVLGDEQVTFLTS